MKRIVAIGIALVFVLGVAGLGVAADKEMVAMKHDDVKICGNVNCCGAQEKAKEWKSNETKEQTVPSRIEDLKPSDG